LWYIAGDPRVDIQLRNELRDPNNRVFLSVVSAWEIIIKHLLGKLPLPEPPEILIPQARHRHGFHSLELDEASILRLMNLPPLHKDPFDRLLIGQALEHDLTLVTVDAAIRAYPVSVR
ncbi:MAG: type II toxin-antitoxin system VapC family toxin, partial [Armatimonadetes bacterium]|nr:type II toxin-antitoxin system VapC family toxin [Armatimonadota bacterium]